MLSFVEAINPLGKVLTLPIGSTAGGIFVDDITGLDPAEATIVSSNFANLDGARFQSSRTEKRTIVLRLGLDPDYVTNSPDSIRKVLYEWFMSRENVELQFVFTQGYRKIIRGIVSDFEAPRFVKELTAAITVTCFDPFFYDEQEQIFEGNTVSTESNSTVEYTGNVRTGFTLRLPMTRSTSIVQITTNRMGEDKTQLEFIMPMTSADTLIINSTPGSKSAVVERLGVELPALANVRPYSTWPLLYPGDNLVRVNVTGSAMPYTLTWLPRDGAI